MSSASPARSVLSTSSRSRSSCACGAFCLAMWLASLTMNAIGTREFPDFLLMRRLSIVPRKPPLRTSPARGPGGARSPSAGASRCRNLGHCCRTTPGPTVVPCGACGLCRTPAPPPTRGPRLPERGRGPLGVGTFVPAARHGQALTSVERAVLPSPPGARPAVPRTQLKPPPRRGPLNSTPSRQRPRSTSRPRTRRYRPPRRSGCAYGTPGLGPARTTGARISQEEFSYFEPALKNAMLAVNPCKKFSPPTGPISPLQNSPAVGIGPSASLSA